MDQKRPRGRAAPPPTPRTATIEEHRQADKVLVFAVAAVQVLEEQFGFTREQSKQWFDLAVDRAKADENTLQRPLW